MNLFVIGDVHGCCKTFQSLLEHWDCNNEILIQLGDLIDRGNHVPQTVKLVRAIQKKYHNAFFLKGNHEAAAIGYLNNKTNNWHERFGKDVLWQYALNESDFTNDVEWFKQMPLYWENEYVFVSHAGISKSLFCMEESHPEGILLNRGILKNIGKLQVIGHTPQKKASYMANSNSWNIDTGAFMGKKLTGIKLKENGEFIELISQATFNADVS